MGGLGSVVQEFEMELIHLIRPPIQLCEIVFFEGPPGEDEPSQASV